MKVLQYNIWNGCRDDERYERLENFLTSKNYDMIAFNELKYWKPDEFEEKMKRLGYHYSYMLQTETSLHYLGIASKHPIEKVFSTEKSPFHHSLLHVKVCGINFILTHLSPFSGAVREKEASYIAGYIQPYMKEPVILMGDLNTLSPMDHIYYEEKKLADRFMLNERAQKRHIKNGSLNFEPMNILLKAGLYDPSQLDSLEHTMPTKVHKNWKERPFVRIDYILVNQFFQDGGADVSVVYREDVGKISDHYPVECKLKIKDG